MRLFILVLLVVSVLICSTNCYSSEDFDRKELYWLTLNCYHEARGEDVFGILAVALVTLERKKIGKWGDTIQEVVTAPSQFSWYSDGKSDIPTDEKAWDKCKKLAYLAKMIYSASKSSFGITHYHEKDAKPYWRKKLTKVTSIGNHIFYKEDM